MIAGLMALAMLTSAQSTTLDAAVERERKLQRASSVSVAVARDGRIVYAKAFGEANPARHVAAAPQTIYAIGSLTKQFTAALVMRLVERGDVALDAKIARYLPATPHGDEISVRYLLDQRSGLPDFLGLPGVVPFLRDPGVTPERLVALVASKPLDFVPGSKWAYSNTNYVVLGMLVAKVTGESYEAALGRAILRPLGLSSTSASIPPPGPRVALGLEWNDAAAAWKPVERWSSQVAYAAGELNSSTLDLIAWDAAFFANEVVSADSVRTMTTPATLENGTSDAYGFGWIVGTAYGRREIWHNGGIPGFSARNAYFPVEHIAIVVLANSLNFDAGPIVREALAQSLGLSAAERTAYDRPAAAPGEDPGVTALARTQFEAFAAGHTDPAAFTPALNAALNADMLAQVRDGLRTLGPLRSLTFVGKTRTGDFDTYAYKVDCEKGSVRETLSVGADGKIGGIYFAPWGG